MPPKDERSTIISPDAALQSTALGVVVIVDPYSTGCLVAQEISKRGYLLIALWSDGFVEEMKTHVPMSCGHLEYLAHLDEAKTLKETGERVLNAAAGYPLSGCIAGGEAGVDLADALSEYLGVQTNGTEIPNRRDKKVQQELIRADGLRAVRQAGGANFSDVEGFLKSEEYPLVLKPVESAGSDGVKLCFNFEEAKEHFHLLMKSQMVNGGQCPAVLCQEFLRGIEYVVDHVSLDGVHKTMMVWMYDKRKANGGDFVYFGCVPVDSESPVAKQLIPYTRKVLDSLGVKNGPSHGEVIMTKDGPCLVEMNCRAHGGDGNWRPLCRALTGGYSQVEASADAFVDPNAFRRLPDKPPSPFKASGQEVILVSFSRGKVKSMPGYEVMKQLPSFVCLETGIKPGSEVDYTIDLFTGIGSIILMHKDEAVLKRDIEFVRYMEEINGIFLYETKLENLKRPRGEQIALEQVSRDKETPGSPQPSHHKRVFSSDGPMLVRHLSNDRPELRGPLVKRMTTVDSSKEVVVIVDPYSTGSCVAHEIMKRGYKVIALWTKTISDALKNHQPLSCGKLDYYAEITESKFLAETVNEIYKLANDYRIVACLPGGDTGCDVSDALSERLNVRTNGAAVSGRRDKFIQQQLVKKAGLQSIRQVAGSKFSDVEKFLRSENYPLVLKPASPYGSDCVKLCHDFEEAKMHFDTLKNRETFDDGKEIPVVICQEFLRGKEFVVDHVSRDGVHKTTMVWTYDKRPANGAHFVYFGCLPVEISSREADMIIPYVRKVLDAMGIKNGASHAEVIMTNDGPCLVEMNCRTHGGDGIWRPLCLALTGGYTQIESCVDAYLDRKQFHILPERPASPYKAHGQEVILVSYSKGTVKSTPGFKEIEELQSFVYLETGVTPGSHVDHTTDLFSSVGSVILMHRDQEVLERDIARIRQLEKENLLFEYESRVGLMRAPSDLHLTRLNVSESNRTDLY